GNRIGKQTQPITDGTFPQVPAVYGLVDEQDIIFRVYEADNLAYAVIDRQNDALQGLYGNTVYFVTWEVINDSQLRAQRCRDLQNGYHGQGYEVREEAQVLLLGTPQANLSQQLNNLPAVSCIYALIEPYGAPVVIGYTDDLSTAIPGIRVR